MAEVYRRSERARQPTNQVIRFKINGAVGAKMQLPVIKSADRVSSPHGEYRRVISWVLTAMGFSLCPVSLPVP